jgi:proteasome lid subunit RPN8/RPN11
MRRGELPAVSAHPVGSIEPVWDAARGQPYCGAVRVSIPADGGNGASVEIPTSYFAELAQKASSELVADGRLGAGDRYRYRVCAEVSRTSRSGSRPGVAVAAIVTPIAVGEASLDQALANVEPRDDLDPDDAPVLIPRAVLTEVERLAADAGELETGGVLVGQLLRDIDAPEIFVAVSAQIPARHARPSRMGFEFTPETWADARTALRLRDRGEEILGWWHSHPLFCRSCPPESRRLCRFARPFFSLDDRHLHRTVFERAHQVALLVSDLPDEGQRSALFAWRRGRIMRRGFHVTPSA